MDLTVYWFVENKTSIKVYVFDNHRPIHHHNIADKNNVIFFILFKKSKKLFLNRSLL